MTTTVREHLNALPDEQLSEILRRDYLRKSLRYKKTDELLRQKYGMSFEEFGQRNIVAEKKFSWEVESDAQDWELAIDGIRTVERKLSELDGRA